MPLNCSDTFENCLCQQRVTDPCKGMCEVRTQKVKETFLLPGTDKDPSSGFVTLFALFDDA